MSCVEGGAQSLMLDRVTCRLLPHASQNLRASTVRLSDKQRRDTVTEKETFRRPCGGKTPTGWEEGEERGTGQESRKNLERIQEHFS